MSYNVFDVADWFIEKAQEDGGEISPKKLQKLLYYAYSWSLVFFNESSGNLSEKLFENNIEAWVHGPVIPEVYHEYKKYGYDPIVKDVKKPCFSEDTEDVLNQVWDIYGGYNGNQLESITHQEEPWIEARGDSKPLDASNVLLNDKTIFSYYLGELEANG